jgi:hypothetical protein
MVMPSRMLPSVTHTMRSATSHVWHLDDYYGRAASWAADRQDAVESRQPPLDACQPGAARRVRASEDA